MPVAKTYSSLKIKGEPFKENGRMYVYVLSKKGDKKVRWYTEKEYSKLYPSADNTINSSTEFNARYAFGFRDEGFITLYKGDEEEIKSWAQAQYPPKAWHNTLFHFFTPGFMPVENLPRSIIPVRMTWESVALEGNIMKSDEEVQKVIDSLVGDPNVSEYQGEVNDWLDCNVTVQNNVSKENHFGEKHLHTLKDKDGNLYFWETGAKNFEKGSSITLRMKVKDHKVIDGKKHTIVWYCKEI